MLDRVIGVTMKCYMKAIAVIISDLYSSVHLRICGSAHCRSTGSTFFCLPGPYSLLATTVLPSECTAEAYCRATDLCISV